MKSDYQTRAAQAAAYYKAGLDRVRNTPPPDGQKYPPGTRVKIADKMPLWMAHFECGKFATVEYTYGHAYGGGNVTQYSLNIDGVGSVAWYNEDQIEAAQNGAPMERDPASD